MSTKTEAVDVVEHFCVSSEARSRFDRWRLDRPEVAAYVLGHVTRTPYETTRDDLTRVIEETEHALGNIKKRDIKDVTLVGDWHPRFAMMHVLHYALETFGGPFTFQAFRDFCGRDPGAREMLWDPAQALVADASPLVGRSRAKAAMKWRIGLAYYSFLRELVTIVELRNRGIELEMHPLADALFRVDCWIDRTAVGLYIASSKYRDGAAGRKPQPEHVLGSGFSHVAINIPAQHDFGVVHLPSAEALDTAASQIKRALPG